MNNFLKWSKSWQVLMWKGIWNMLLYLCRKVLLV